MDLPKPYYDEDDITLYHGDCLDILPLIEPGSIDLVLTDPPYGIGASDFGHKNKGRHGWTDFGPATWDYQPPPPEVFEYMRVTGKHQIIWGGNYFADMLPATMGWLVWNKMQREFTLADGELAWTSFKNALRIFDYSRSAALLDGKVHPTQKPVYIMKRCIDYADRHGSAQTILDPFLGSGTTAVAAKNLGRKCIGIELEEKYLDIAVNRLRQGVLAL